MTFDLASRKICISVDNSVGNVVVSGSNRWKSLYAKRWTRGFKTHEWCGRRTIITAVYFRDTRIPQDQTGEQTGRELAEPMPVLTGDIRSDTISNRGGLTVRTGLPTRITRQDVHTNTLLQQSAIRNVVSTGQATQSTRTNQPRPINPHDQARRNSIARSHAVPNSPVSDDRCPGTARY